MRGINGKLCFSEKDRGIVWKGYMARIMNEERNWDHNVDEDAVDITVVCASREDVLQSFNEMKTGNVPGPSHISLELFGC